MTDRSIQYKNSVLHYVVIGSGAEPLLLFHGFGQDHSAFRTLTQALDEKYTMYCFDLYYHGKSVWGHGERPLDVQYWKETLTIFLTEHHIDRYSLLGFSLGANMVLASLVAFPGRVNSVWLLAPDGIKPNFWYTIATYPFLLRKLFKSMISHHGRFVAIIRVLDSLSLLNPGVIRFAERQMNTYEKRYRVYFSWVVFRHLKFNMKTIGKLFNDNSILLTVVAGKFDPIYPPRHMNRLLKWVKDYHFEVVEAGHLGVIQASLPAFGITSKSGDAGQ
jgi:pimeloyl-ACP methyl ester carboxylesterase